MEPIRPVGLPERYTWICSEVRCKCGFVQSTTELFLKEHSARKGVVGAFSRVAAGSPVYDIPVDPEARLVVRETPTCLRCFSTAEKQHVLTHEENQRRLRPKWAEDEVLELDIDIGALFR